VYHSITKFPFADKMNTRKAVIFHTFGSGTVKHAAAKSGLGRVKQKDQAPLSTLSATTSITAYKFSKLNESTGSPVQ
jgi:hypothetical protein